MADPAGPALTLRFVAGPDVDALDVPPAEILAAVEGAVRAQGEGMPLGIVDATLLTAARTGALTALARSTLADHLGRPVRAVATRRRRWPGPTSTSILDRRSGGEIVAGRAPGRERPDERVLFWHRGLATTDLAVANLFLRRAAEAGLGTLLRYR